MLQPKSHLSKKKKTETGFKATRLIKRAASRLGFAPGPGRSECEISQQPLLPEAPLDTSALCIPRHSLKEAPIRTVITQSPRPAPPHSYNEGMPLKCLQQLCLPLPLTGPTSTSYTKNKKSLTESMISNSNSVRMTFLYTECQR